MDKFILIGNDFSTSMGGPTGVIRELNKTIKKKDIHFSSILYTENVSKIRIIKKIIDACLKERNAVINVHTEGYLFATVVLFCSKINKHNNYYLTVHGLFTVESTSRGLKKKIYELIERNVIRHFCNLICVSEMLRRDILSIYERKKRVFVIPNATDAKSNLIPVPTREPIRFVFLGGLRKRKGIEHNLSLFRKLKERRVYFEADIFGSHGNNEEWFQKEIKEMGLTENIEYHGLESNKQIIYDKIAISDFQLCLSRYDTYNVSIAESLVLGCPVIASNKCGASYLINNESGIVVDVEDESFIDDVCDYISLFLNDPQKRIDVFDNRIKYKDLLLWDNIANRYLSLME